MIVQRESYAKQLMHVEEYLILPLIRAVAGTAPGPA
jgi:hypothetical protein